MIGAEPNSAIKLMLFIQLSEILPLLTRELRCVGERCMRSFIRKEREMSAADKISL
jgi:hypothetical protein